MLNRTRRLLGLAKSSSALRDWDDPRAFDLEPPSAGWSPTPDGSNPDWKDDLESLFRLVDSRLAERRSLVAGPVDGQVERRQAGTVPEARALTDSAPPPAPPHIETWLGFGLEEPTPVAAESAVESVSVEQLAGRVVSQLRATLLEGEVMAGIRAAAREAVEEALRERLATEVRAGVEDALREAAAAWDDDRQMAPSTILSIRVRQRRSRRSA